MGTAVNTSGLAMFARYAFAPNQLGYCGPGTTDWITELDDPKQRSGLGRVVREFEGAYPYLELIAGCHGLDPLDHRVVEAYWVGNGLLAGVDTLVWGNSLDERFRHRTGARWSVLETGIGDGRPTHAFHVFCVYPWVGLLRAGNTDAALRVIDRCRIRWGRVLDVAGGLVVAESRSLTWDGRCLSLGNSIVESVRQVPGGPQPAPGDVVAMHWDVVCDTISDRQASALRGETIRHLDLVNASTRQLAGVVER
jgi:Family of unknown function (DUF6390)